jgi:hypothetical protein
MMASPDCRGLYKALRFLVLSSQRISARAVDSGTQFLVLNCRSLGSGKTDIIVTDYQEALLGTFQFLPKDAGVNDVQPSI